MVCRLHATALLRCVTLESLVSALSMWSFQAPWSILKDLKQHLGTLWFWSELVSAAHLWWAVYNGAEPGCQQSILTDRHVYTGDTKCNPGPGGNIWVKIGFLEEINNNNWSQFWLLSPAQKILFRTIFTLVCVKYNVARGGNHINIIITTDSRGDNHNKLGQNKNRICHTVHYSLLTIIKGTAELYNSRGFLQARVNNHHRYNKSGLILSKVLTKKLTFGNLPKQLLPWLV